MSKQMTTQSARPNALVLPTLDKLLGFVMTTRRARVTDRKGVGGAVVPHNPYPQRSAVKGAKARIDMPWFGISNSWERIL
jgi:hypothetical protein